jgi:hypothetical protein
MAARDIAATQTRRSKTMTKTENRAATRPLQDDEIETVNGGGLNIFGRKIVIIDCTTPPPPGGYEPGTILVNPWIGGTIPVV